MSHTPAMARRMPRTVFAAASVALISISPVAVATTAAAEPAPAPVDSCAWTATASLTSTDDADRATGDIPYRVSLQLRKKATRDHLEWRPSVRIFQQIADTAHRDADGEPATYRQLTSGYDFTFTTGAEPEAVYTVEDLRRADGLRAYTAGFNQFSTDDTSAMSAGETISIGIDDSAELAFNSDPAHRDRGFGLGKLVSAAVPASRTGYTATATISGRTIPYPWQNAACHDLGVHAAADKVSAPAGTRTMIGTVSGTTSDTTGFAVRLLGADGAEIGSGDVAADGTVGIRPNEGTNGGATARIIRTQVNPVDGSTTTATIGEIPLTVIDPPAVPDPGNGGKPDSDTGLLALLKSVFGPFLDRLASFLNGFSSTVVSAAADSSEHR